MGPINRKIQKYVPIIQVLAPILLVLLIIFTASFLIGYRPILSLRSQQLLNYVLNNSANLDLNKSSGATQNAIALNRDNCVAYGILGNNYAYEAFTILGSQDKPNINMLKMEINIDEEGVQLCPISRTTLFMEYALARDYSMTGNHAKSIYYLKSLIATNPINVKSSVLDLKDLNAALDSEISALNH